MSARTFGAGTMTFPNGYVAVCESLTITVNGEDITEGCEIDLTMGQFTLPVTVTGASEGLLTVVTSYRKRANLPKTKRTAEWKQRVYGPRRPTSNKRP